MVEPAPSERAEDRAPRRPKRRRRLLKLAIIAALSFPLLLVAFVVLTIVFLPWIFSGEELSDQAVRALTEHLGVPVEIARLEYHPFTGIELFGVVIGPPPGFEEDVARIERVALRYDLSGITSRRVVLREIAVESPQLVVETKLGEDGQPLRNIDVLSARFAGPSEPPPDDAPPEPPSGGPLSPITLVLERLALSDLSLRVVGLGPNLAFTGASFGGRASIDPERLEARFGMSIAPRGGARHNLILQVPASEEAPSASAELALVVTTTLSVSGGARDGLELEAARVSSSIALSGRASQGEVELPPLAIQARGDAVVDPGADRAGVDVLRLELDGAPLVDAAVDVQGLVTALQEGMGRPAGDALAASLGLVARAPSGRVRVDVKTLALPLDRLAPYARTFVPEASMRGTIAVAPLEAEGSVAELIRGEPRVFRLVLGFEKVSGGLGSRRLGDLSGAVRLERRAADAPPAEGRFGLSGSLALRDLRDGPDVTVQAIDVVPSGRFDRLTHPLPGPALLGVEVETRGVHVAGAQVQKVKLGARLEGTELLAEERPGLDPVRIGLALGVEGARVRTGTVSHAMDGVSASLSLELDRLLPAARARIPLRGELALGRAESGPHRVRGARARMDGAVSDPRTGAPIDADLHLALSSGVVESAPVTLTDGQIDVKLGLADIAPRKLPGAPPASVPATAGLSLSVSLPKIHVRDGELDTTTRLAMVLDGHADVVGGEVSIDRAELDFADLVRVRARGRLGGLFRKERTVDARFDLLPVDLAALVARVPPAFAPRLEGLTASGSIGLEGRARGTIPATFAGVDLADPPISGGTTLFFKDVSVRAPSRGLVVSGLGGRVGVEVARGRTELSSDLAVTRLEADGDGAIFDGLRHRMHAGLRGEVWSMTSELDAQRGGGVEEGVAPPRFDVDFVYTKRGDVELRRFDVGAPFLGFEVSAQGRLARGSYGVFRPEFALQSRFDLGHIARHVPEVGDTRGVVSFKLAALPRSETTLDVSGALELDGVSHAREGLAVRNATGRVPFEQRLILPRPVMRELVAGSEGQLGDDLERRLDELGGDLLASKMSFDAEDILLEPPRSADHQALRPFFGARGANLTIESVNAGGQELRSIVFDGLWRSGVLRLDRFAARIWEGDVLGDFAFQLTADEDARARFRATLTNLNLDIPYALVHGIPPVSDPKAKRQYAISGTIDTRAVIRDRSLTLKMDLTRLDKPTLERLFDGLIDPKRENPTINNARTALNSAGFMGLRMSGGQVTISQNRFGAHFDFERVWIDLKREPAWMAVLAPFRWVARLVFGPIIIANVNGAFADKLSVGPWLDEVFAKYSLDAVFRPLAGRVISSDEAAEDAARQVGATTREVRP